MAKSDQLALFPDIPPDVTVAPIPHALHRTGDPTTSTIAAGEILPTMAKLQRWATKCVTETRGATQAELGRKYCPTDPRRIGRRMAGCERAGMVRRGDKRKCEISGRMAETWWASK